MRLMLIVDTGFGRALAAFHVDALLVPVCGLLLVLIALFFVSARRLLPRRREVDRGQRGD